MIESLLVETLTCSCGAKVMRPIGSSSLCACGKEVAATDTTAKHTGEEAGRKGLDIAHVQTHGPRPLIPLEDKPTTEER
jgi:hypothetical protein